MKLLATGDIHINDWNKYSELDSAGRPSRLMQYIDLAKDLGKLAVQENCDGIILAGDISEKCVQRPRVLDVIGDFLRILSEYKPVYLIHGQHDCDTKQTEIMYQNSILKEICKDLEDHEVYYFGEPKLEEIGGMKVMFQPWTETHELPNKSADVFVGHGLVAGSSNLDGHIFNNGFCADELTARYRLSIIGDVHNGQAIDAEMMKGRKILIPGSPIQNTWKDAHNCGVWTAEITGKDDSPKLKFFNIHEIHPDFYHQFTYDGASTDLVHSKPKIKKEKKKQSSDEIKLERNLDTILSTCMDIVDEDKVAYSDKVKTYIQQCFENIKDTDDKVIADSEVLSVRMKNFLSVDEFSIGLDEFPSSCVIVGKNGTGKTTLPEAIYWCLTGTTTKEIPVTGIVNTFKEDNDCFVSVELRVGKNNIVVTRRREGSTSSLELENNGSVFKRGSIRETQQEIYDLLGLNQWQIKMFSYFSAQNTSLFAGLGDSAKNDLLSQIVGLNFLEGMRDYSKKEKNTAKNKLLKSEGSLASADHRVNSLESKLRQLALELKDQDTSHITNAMTDVKNEMSLASGELRELNQNAKALLEGYESLESLQDDLTEKNREASSLEKKITKAATTKATANATLAQKKTALKKALTGKCYTCDQPLQDDKTVKALKAEITTLVTGLKELPNIEELESQVADLEEEINLLSKNVKEVLNANSKVQKKVQQISSLKNKLKELDLELKKEKQDNSILDHVKQDLEDAKNEKTKYDGLILEYGIEQDCWKYIETDLLKKKGNLIKKLNEQGAILIQKCINEILIDTGFAIKIANDLKITGKFHNSVWLPYESLSSGQKRVVDVTLMVAMNNLFSKIYNLDKGVLGLVVYDEILSFLDEEYIETAKNIVDQSISNKILIITHDHGLMNMYDSRIKVQMTKSGSLYSKSWM